MKNGIDRRTTRGIAVFSGMIGVTAFGLLLTPVFYVLVRRFGKAAEAPVAATLAAAPVSLAKPNQLEG